MKRSLLYLLFAILVAGWLGTLIARDPGYVLISYGDATLQTGLWVMLALLLVVILGGYYTLRIFRVIGQTGVYLKAFRAERERARSAELSARGLTYFQQGDFERALKFLESGARGNSNASVNLVYAARAADACGKKEDRERLLREAIEADEDSRDSVAVARAEMALARREWHTVLKGLQNASENDTVIRLRSKAMLELGEWENLLGIIPQLRKITPDSAEMFAFEKRVALARLAAPKTTDDALAIVYRKLADEVKRDEDVLRTYCAQLSSEKEKESVLREALKKTWNSSLLELYGSLGMVTLVKRTKTAENWQKSHADDPSLHLCLGLLYEAAGEREKAKYAYQKSVDAGSSDVANERLGRLLAFDGDYKKSNEYLTQALKLSKS